MESSLPVGEELRVFRAEGAREQAMKRKKSFVFHALRKPLFARVLGLPQQPYRTGGLGRAVERRSLHTCHHGCWWVFLGVSFVPVCFRCIFLQPSGHSDTHFCDISGHSVRRMWTGRGPGQRQLIFHSLLIFKYKNHTFQSNNKDR